MFTPHRVGWACLVALGAGILGLALLILIKEIHVDAFEHLTATTYTSPAGTGHSWLLLTGLIVLGVIASTLLLNLLRPGGKPSGWGETLFSGALCGFLFAVIVWSPYLAHNFFMSGLDNWANNVLDTAANLQTALPHHNSIFHVYNAHGNELHLRYTRETNGGFTLQLLPK